MMDEDKRVETLVRLARVKINLAVTIMVIGIVVIIQLLFFPDPFTTVYVEPVVAEDIAPDFSVDPSEIVDGIHVPSGLIADDGFEIVLNTCGKCHSIDLVTQNRATEEGWKEMIVWMQKTQGLWDLGKYELPIIAYLTKNYAPKNTGRRKNLENIEWYNLKD